MSLRLGKYHLVGFRTAVQANPVQNITALGSDPARLELGQMAARMWTSFVTDLDPNGHGGEFQD
jgi:hypothetical protein